ncbi:hypothetical protein VTK56DRAFT_2598 [Thermocarpiscus australiensis]
MALLRQTRVLFSKFHTPLSTTPKITNSISSPSSNKAATTASTTTTVLEVERKFRALAVPTLLLTPGSSSNLKHYNYNNTLLPQFTSVQPLPCRTIHDVYFDDARRRLGAAGAWVRRGGDFVHSRFEGLRGAEEVGRCVRGVLGLQLHLNEPQEGEGDGDNFGLEKVAEFVTTREAWVVDGEFKVVRDRMDFGHEVGEVELQVVVDKGLGGEEKAALMEEVDGRIERFMRRYRWAWEEGEAVGKLTAYFEMVRKKGL